MPHHEHNWQRHMFAICKNARSVTIHWPMSHALREEQALCGVTFIGPDALQCCICWEYHPSLADCAVTGPPLAFADRVLTKLLPSFRSCARSFLGVTAGGNLGDTELCLLSDALTVLCFDGVRYGLRAKLAGARHAGACASLSCSSEDSVAGFDGAGRGDDFKMTLPPCE